MQEPIFRIEVDFVSVVLTDDHDEKHNRVFLREENPGLYKRARKAATERDYAQLFTLSSSLLDDLREIDRRFHIEPDGSIRFDGILLQNYVVDNIRKCVQRGVRPTNWVNFLKNTLANPHAITVEDIHRFLSKHESCPITEDGAILAYKKVDKNYMSFFASRKTGQRERWAPGEEVSLPREECDHDRNETCSAGLHFCSRDYLPHSFGGEGHIVMVKIFPQDIVSIPVEYRDAKGRCCRAFVLRDIPDYDSFAFSGSAYTEDGLEVDGPEMCKSEMMNDLAAQLLDFLTSGRLQNLCGISRALLPHKLVQFAHEFFELEGSNFVYDTEDVVRAIDQREELQELAIVDVNGHGDIIIRLVN